LLSEDIKFERLGVRYISKRQVKTLFEKQLYACLELAYL